MCFEVRAYRGLRQCEVCKICEFVVLPVFIRYVDVCMIFVTRRLHSCR